MLARTLLAATVLLMLAHPAMAQAPLATYKSLSPGLALDLASEGFCPRHRSPHQLGDVA
ncbi:hypothetical protein ACVIWV_006384 [Bradyrhizobium diazoefficiens]|jgi:hypothetical protein|uniref:hypothetical protein n=1 Tax=Bradyrhizobium TaxID=374 RepID=UPI000A9FCD80|nr:hypothetical protein [Bradyrhizobium diazoefficiens]MBP1095904.1 hypothetical protein [Bradyrhizobium japonicum]MBR0867935.1 hypothetical protein [Bradyrhizobium diazoefficiens]